MKRIIMPEPPDPMDYATNPVGFQRAVSVWMGRVKSTLEQNLNQNAMPCITPMVVTSFTTNTSLTGTSTLGDVANALCTLIQALTNKGIISSSFNR